MLFGDQRRELRRFLREAWHKRLSGAPLQPLEALVAEVVGEHPEYHGLLESEDALEQDFGGPEPAPNPFLHLAMHIALREQLGGDRPPGIAAVHRALCTRLGDAAQAEHRMMECLGESLWRAQSERRLPDEDAYLECLKRL